MSEREKSIEEAIGAVEAAFWNLADARNGPDGAAEVAADKVRQAILGAADAIRGASGDGK